MKTKGSTLFLCAFFIGTAITCYYIKTDVPMGKKRAKIKMKKIAIITITAVMMVLTTGFSNTITEQKYYIKQTPEPEPQKLESVGKMFVKKNSVDGNYYLYIINTTGKDMCLHVKIKGYIDAYGLVPAWANSKEDAVYIYFCTEEFKTKDVKHKRDHSDRRCPKMYTSQY